MRLNLQYNPYIPPVALTALVAVLLGYLAWRLRARTRGVAPFVLMTAAVAIWSGAYAVELAATDLATKLVCIPFEYLGIVSAPVALLLFVADYTGRENWLTRRNVALLFVVPAITLIVLLTDNLHHLFYTRIALDASGSFPNLSLTYGLWFWIHSTYSYLAMLVGTILLVRSLLTFPDVYRGQAVTLLIGVIAPWVANAIYIFKVSPFAKLDLTPFGFAITGLMLGLSLIRYRLLDILPAARDAVFSSLRDPVIVLDKLDRIVDLNPAAQSLIGSPEASLIGTPAVKVIANRPDLIERFRDAADAQDEITLSAQGTERTYDLRISTLYNQRRKPSGRLIVLRDISDAKQAHKQLIQARDRAVETLNVRSRMVAMVSHDFLTPLSTIIGYSDMLSQNVLGPLTTQQQDVIKRMTANASELLGLVNSLLDEAQLESGKLAIKVTSFEPAKLAGTLEANLRHKAEDKGLKLSVEVAAGLPPTVTGDPHRLTQVLNNLVENAVKFTEKGGVTVKFVPHDTDQWSVAVADTGPGIAPRDREHIFEPFWQSDNPATQGHKGIGLGLSIASQLAARMGGRLTLESQVGKGSTFTVTLPVKSAGEVTDVKPSGADR